MTSGAQSAAPRGVGESDGLETGPVGDPVTDGLDLQALRDYLAAVAPDQVGPKLTARLLAGGKSNLTYEIDDGSHTWVVRRPPLGHILATAHDMGREYRVMSALDTSAVPVPRTIALCSDVSVIGAPFYLMDRVDGVAIRDMDMLGRLGPDAVRALVFGLVDILADLHAIDPESVGLSDFGRPEGYNARQLARWDRQMTASLTGDVPGLAALTAELAKSVPASPAPTIVHGDYRLDNVLVRLPETGRPARSDGRGRPASITAVLDWEMSTLGDPIGDLALTLLYAERPPAWRGDGTAGLPAVAVPGHPTAAEMARRYATRLDRELPDLRWYSAFARFKLAAIMQGVHHRYIHGSYGRQEGFAGMGEAVAPLIADALQMMREG
jgi:aminoglycoside phosphotransferase (APT) family kinase protein